MEKNNVVKILTSEDGDIIKYAKWCLIDPADFQGNSALCSKQYFGIGESSCQFKVKKGRITCKDCLEKIKIYKSIKF